MKRSLLFLVMLLAVFAPSCNNASQNGVGAQQDTNYSDSRRNSGDTGYSLKTDSGQQKDLIDVNPPQKQRE